MSTPVIACCAAILIWIGVSPPRRLLSALALRRQSSASDDDPSILPIPRSALPEIRNNDNNGSQPGIKGTAVSSIQFGLNAGTEPGTSGGSSYEKTIDFGLRDCPAITITPTTTASTPRP